MDELDFTNLRQALLDWPSVALYPTGASTSPLLGRLRQILEPARTQGAFTSLPDLMVLMRQLLLSRRTEGPSELLNVPRNQEWPTENLWKTFGFRVTRTPTRFVLQAVPWHPDWIGDTTNKTDDVFLPEYQPKQVRKDAGLPMDPFLREVTGYTDYVCPGQREALVSALFMRPGHCLIVNLPTGSGKSLVAQAPVLVRGLSAGLTLVVVPTNALALDLERRTRQLLKHKDTGQIVQELAWMGGRIHADREAIKERIRSGRQGILFASPEAVCGPLLKSLYIAAEKGLIAYLVVDEAHLIAQWGDAFRPAFQQLAGVRRGLLEVCPSERFRTLLLSATFSQQVIVTLKALFGPTENINMVSAVHLRPEPRYFGYLCTGSDDKQARIDELIRHTPRPFILYSTKRKDARDWFQRLYEVGFRRIACVHGETPNEERERIIGDWVEDRIDGVIATSAFGVGMDKSDVRTVIHAALPETLDRFYQEVGRGGRDGLPCLSITLFDRRDINIARGMTTPTLIGDEKGFERWSTLYREAERDPRDRDVRLVDLRKRPGHQIQESEYNRDWNMRTLILLARAGLIQLESNRPLQIERGAEESEAAFKTRTEAEQESYFSHIPVRSLDARLMKRSHFERQVGIVRQRGAEAASRSFNQMLKALTGEHEMAEVLVELLASDDVVVSPACRGCPASAGHHEGANEYQIPPGIGISKLVPYNTKNWEHRFSDLDPSLVIVLLPDDTSEGDVLRAIQAAVSSFGVQEVALAPALRQSQVPFSELHRWASDRILIFRDLSESLAAPDTLPLPRATVLMPWGDDPLPDDFLLLDRPVHLVFAPAGIRDAQHPLRLYRDTATNFIELQEFLRRATQ